MDANASYPLVVLPHQQETLVPVSLTLSADSDAKPDLLAWLWRRFCKLALLFFLAFVALRRLRLQLVELRQQANYWRALHQRAVLREADLAERIQLLQGQIRELERRLYGRKSETSANTKPPINPNDPRNHGKPRKRGQQPGSKGHGRRNHDHLPTTDEVCVLPDHQKCCADCGTHFTEIPGSQDGDILEIEVHAYRRRYHRQRYQRH